MSTAPAVFENNAWNQTLPGVIVFDDVFIDLNVHSGLSVGTQHRQNLHELILGAQSVTLSRRLQQLVEKIETHNRELRSKERAIPAAVRGPFLVDEFCALPLRSDIGQAIQEAERAAAAGQEQASIRTTPPFELLNLPAFDVAAIDSVLRQDLPSINAATLNRVQAHLTPLGDDGESWVAAGTHLSDGQNCPFCAQNLQSSPIATHYRTYFSEEYAALKNAAVSQLVALTQSHGGEVSAGFERAVRVLVEHRQFWSRFCEIPSFALDTATIVRNWRAAREALIKELSVKKSAPLGRGEISTATRQLLSTYEVHRQTINTINQSLEDANRTIALAKEQAVNVSSGTLANDVLRLKAVKARHEPANASLCEEYLQERAAKQETERERDQIRESLEQHRASVFPGFQTAINLYLTRFYAGFRLGSISHANTRGGPTCTYNVVINNTSVAIGSDSATGEPNFRSTLSAGDRNTLALAFFFASLDQDQNLAQKVIIIDDPISSLDENRALTTVQEIRRLAGRTAQVIVLSHSKPLLCRLWEGAETIGRAAIEVIRDGAGSTLRVWDVNQDSITEHDRRHILLAEFLTNGTLNAREIARSIRPHFEAFFRVAYPKQYPPATLLGTFRNICEQRIGTSQQILDGPLTQELREIVEYANRFHHDTNPAWETETINDGELRGFVERTLRLVRK